MIELQYRTNNAYDSVLKVEDGIVVGQWTVDPQVKADYDDAGDPREYYGDVIRRRAKGL